MSAIKILEHENEQFFIFFPDTRYLTDTYPFSGKGGTDSGWNTTTIQPRLYFGDYSIRGRSAFKSILKNIYIEDSWNEKDVLMYISAAAEHGWVSVIKELLEESRVMVGSGVEMPDGHIIIDRILVNPNPPSNIRPLNTIAELVLFPIRDKNGFSLAHYQAIKTRNPIVKKYEHKWVRFSKEGTVIDSFQPLQKIIPQALDAVKMPSNIYKSCTSDEIIQLLQLKRVIYR